MKVMRKKRLSGAPAGGRTVCVWLWRGRMCGASAAQGRGRVNIAPFPPKYDARLSECDVGREVAGWARGRLEGIKAMRKKRLSEANSGGGQPGGYGYEGCAGA